MQRQTSGSKHSLKLLLAVILTSMTLAFFSVSVVAQEVKTDTQPPADAAQQNAVTAEQSFTTPEQTEVEKTKTAYFGPARMAWDTTTKYSSMFRLAKRSAAIYDPTNNPSNFDQNDGDNNFHRGLVGNRIDILTEMDVSFGPNFGFRGSAASWYEPTYNQRTANRFIETNALSSDSAHFPAQTKDLQYLQAELLDAFVHARIPMGNSSLSFRAGQFAQQWGQSVFFGGNAIAGAMAPIDLLKLLSVPNAQFKEVIRPVPQVSAVMQINNKLSVGAYYQLMFVETRFPGVGSYFSNSDILGQGAERFWLNAPFPYLLRIGDLNAKNSGQFGVQVQVRAPRGWDLGFYGVQFHDKAPAIYLAPGVDGFGVPLDPAHFNPAIGLMGSYRLAYAENIKAFGMSATKTTGIINWAAEVSGRINQDLAVAGTIGIPGVNDNNKAATYPSGDTLHANVSALVTLHPNALAKDSSIMAEVAWNDLVSVTKNVAAWNYGNNATKQAIAFMAVYTPTYHQVRSGLDVSVPIGLNFSPYGRSALGPGFATEKGGFFNVGASLAYRDANRFTVTYQRFIGDQGGSVNAHSAFSYKQTYGDRNYLVFSIYRTFGLRASQKAQ